MPSDVLTPAELATLTILMVENREVSNPELKAAYRVSLDGARLRKLRDLKLVESRRGARGANLFLLSDAGWARCRAELGGPVPAGAGAAGAGMYAALAAVGRYLDATGLELADLVAPPAATAPPSAAATSPLADESDDAETAILLAYRSLARDPGGWVSLARLRAELGGLTRTDVDAALLRLALSPGVTIVPESNQKALTAADRSAAVTIGGQANHHIAVGVR